ncbi:ZYRO0F18172p [Zygosaccharomyces rouxii]|uniref:Outer kinetochore KNL1 complex subunit KRE28 n=1 Tax=Zygosaccharomyces rouxii (strain ATCC 2623 / CBS 732 / NBRC 1130 / NCYC 568 / NRRL Y-229) TaxID=559307 RepID=ZWINT_ZYGRC|nr:uncharacterized protein ZYRO0F18172g [Zygosaccharomyces rouxii]C5DZ48.1 RecName: Full=Spindle pole body component KRE28 [Zygosaccharomyces rouxii CBS 732]KAH9201230.1 spindle pole body component [Zygosaccharomyces rouxii]CAQ43315.1 Spindle pole body component YDR532C [Zygosaccharomyces rouxii]CAR29059.1 ZYRO0F18172p [Zygosaccharomyces rouxii]
MKSDLDGYEVRIKSLENQTAHYSEQALLEQEQRVLASLREITQNVIAMGQENSLVEIKGELESKEESELVIDPSGFQEKIDTFVELVELLKVTHLEQETLDNFLRYTISSSNLLQINSVQDAKYVELESQVKELEQGTLESHKREIEATKGQIKNLCQELSMAQDSINETFLDTSNALEECDALLNELTQLRMEKQTSEEADTIEDDPVSQTYEDWESLQKSKLELRLLEEETSRLQSRVESYEDYQKRSRQLSNNDPRMLQNHKALELLVELWMTKFLPQPGISHLELFPQSRKFQFDVEPTFTVVITLADQTTFQNVQVYRKDAKSLVMDHGLNDEIKNSYLGTNNIYNGLNDIIHTLQRRVQAKGSN